MDNNINRREFISKAFKYGSGMILGTALISTISCEKSSDGTYTVDTNKCDGCKDCFSACKYNAISFQNQKATISPSLCMGCGKCPSYCDQDAISKA